MKLALLFWILQIVFIAPSFASPPLPVADNKEYKHCTFFKETEGIKYFVDDLIEELSLRSKLSFVSVNAPIKRCIQMMISGEIDFMSSIHVTAERSNYIDFLFVTEGFSKIVFYTRKDDGDWFNDYSDLQGKTVGTNVGFSYFDKFDLDDSVKKLKVNDSKQLPKMLAAGRLDAYVTYDGLMDVDVSVYPELTKASYLYDVTMSFLAISKQSPLQPHRPLLVDTIKGIIGDGTMEKFSNKYMPGFKLPFTSKDDEAVIQ